MTSAIAVVHSRFSTNVLPRWELAQPFRYIAHNGEINTVRGNRNWMTARETTLDERALPVPIVRADPDRHRGHERLGELRRGRRAARRQRAGPCPHAVLMMIPEAWERSTTMEPARRDFYRYHAALMEPWDGPASVTLLRRARGRGACSTATGCARRATGSPRTAGHLRQRGRGAAGGPVEHRAQGPPAAGPGLPRRRRPRVGSSTTRSSRAPWRAARPTASGSTNAGLARRGRGAARCSPRATRPSCASRSTSATARRTCALIVRHMAQVGEEPIGSMGSDTAAGRPVHGAALALRLLHPALRPGDQPAARRHPRGAGHLDARDPRRRGEPAHRDRRAHCHQIVLASPVLSNEELAKIRYVEEAAARRGLPPGGGRRRSSPPGADPDRRGPPRRGPGRALRRGRAPRARRGQHRHPQRTATRHPSTRPIPSLLLTSAVHHRLVDEHLRTSAALVLEAGDVREVHHVAAAAGLRGLGGLPLPGLRVDRRAGRRGRDRPPRAPSRPATSTPRPSPRAWSRSCPRWA